MALRRLNVTAGVATGFIVYEQSLGSSGWFSIWSLLQIPALLVLIIILPVGWVWIAAGDFRGSRARDAAWWAWLVVPVLAAAWWLGPMRDWPLALRLRVYRAELAALVAEARAMPREGRFARIRRNVGGFGVLHAWVRDEGVYVALARSPDGEIGLFTVDAGAPAPLPAGERPTFIPEGQEWSTYRPIAGGWWLYDWGNP